jgi:hypothetical protein
LLLMKEKPIRLRLAGTQIAMVKRRGANAVWKGVTMTAPRYCGRWAAGLSQVSQFGLDRAANPSLR